MLEQLNIGMIVRQIITAQMGTAPERLTDNADLFADIGVDSLDVVELTMEVEEKLGIEILDEQISDVKTVGQLIDLATKIKGGAK